MRYAIGLEPTAIESSRHDHGVMMDVLDGTRHRDFDPDNNRYKYEEDFALISELNVKSIRYHSGMHKIAKHSANPANYDWDETDRIMASIRDHGLIPTIDLVHHVTPYWTSYDDPNFPNYLLEFGLAFAERYPWIKRYTIINEPFVTMLFCGHEGIWHPYKASSLTFAEMILNSAKAICMVAEKLRELDPEITFLHTDTCEFHIPSDPSNRQVVAWTSYCNERRFWHDDLMRGEVDEAHTFSGYLESQGIDCGILNWYREHPFTDYTRGLDYYSHSEVEWSDFDRHYRPSTKPKGFAAVAKDYIRRYPDVPITVSESNIRGTVYDRISWLKFMVEQCEKLETDSGKEIEFCWYGLADACDWNHLVTQYNQALDPVGLYYLSDHEIHGRLWERNPSELTACYCRLAKGEIGGKDIPAFTFRSPVDKWMSGFQKFMGHWNWIDTEKYLQSKLSKQSSSGTSAIA
jgi:beta-glucosidase/6-phospho-beta-glucosidase/beta-galactosidase